MLYKNLVLMVLLALSFFACVRPKEHAVGDDAKKSVREIIDRFENRKKYTSLDEETLRGIDDKDLEQAIMDYIYYKDPLKPEGIEGDYPEAPDRVRILCVADLFL